jgi:hypothetical protein
LGQPQALAARSRRLLPLAPSQRGAIRLAAEKSGIMARRALAEAGSPASDLDGTTKTDKTHHMSKLSGRGEVLEAVAGAGSYR